MERALCTAARLVAFGAVAILTTGCLRAYQDLTLNADNTVDGTVVFAVDRQLLELSGQTVDDFMQEIGTDTGVPEGVDVETSPYDEGDFVGQEFTFTGAPLEAFDNTGQADELSITREGDTFVVRGTFDATGEEFDTSGIPGGEDLLQGLDVQISVTFPGDVETHNGDLDGTTVTWKLGFGQVNELDAVGSAIGSGGGGGGALLWILLAVGVVVGIVLVVVLMNARKKQAPAAEAAEGVPAAPVAEATPVLDGTAEAASTAPVAEPPPTPTAEPPPAPVPVETPEMPASELVADERSSGGDAGDPGSDPGSGSG